MPSADDDGPAQTRSAAGHDQERPWKAPRLMEAPGNEEPDQSQERRVRQRLQWDGEFPLPPDPNPGWGGHQYSILKGPGEPFPVVCRRCGRRSKTVDGLLKTPCGGRPEGARAVHPSHLLYLTGDFVFCNSCGGFGMTVVSKLKSACRGDHGLSTSARDRLNRLRKGKSPRDCQFLGTPVRLE